MLAFCRRAKETFISTSPFSTFLRYNQLTSSYEKQNFSQSSSYSFCDLIGSRVLSVTGFSGQTLSGWIEIFGFSWVGGASHVLTGTHYQRRLTPTGKKAYLEENSQVNISNIGQEIWKQVIGYYYSISTTVSQA